MKVLYFAWLRQRTGVGEEEVSPPDEVADVAGLVEHLKTLSDGHAAAFQDLSAIKIAVDQEYAPLDAPLAGAREVAFFPPVTGG